MSLPRAEVRGMHPDPRRALLIDRTAGRSETRRGGPVFGGGSVLEGRAMAGPGAFVVGGGNSAVEGAERPPLPFKPSQKGMFAVGTSVAARR